MLEIPNSAGYFDWPRERTAADVADDLWVSSPTVFNYLRKTEDEMLGVLMDEEEGPR